MLTPTGPNGQLPDQGLWSSGSLDHVLRLALPLIIWAVVAFFAVTAFRRGMTLFATPASARTPAAATTPVEPLAEVPAVVPDGRAEGYDGFDPDLYGPRPDPGEPVPAGGSDPTETLV